ncbi:hypothetical protein B7486_64175, partial [cyanobacterium TDX16]
ACNAGGLFARGTSGGIPIIRDLQRANSILYRQSTGLRTRSLVDAFEASQDEDPCRHGRDGILFGLGTTVKDTAEVEAWKARFPEQREWPVGGKPLAQVPTVFDQLEPGLCWALVRHAWWTTIACLARHRPGRADVPPTTTAPGPS